MAGTLDDTADGAGVAVAEGVSFSAGEAVGERYRVIRLLGRGGMGEVYEVEDTVLGGRVALKALRSPLAADARAQERLRREVQLARRITHAHVCRLFDVGSHGEVPFLTMELLPGETLAERIARGPLAAAEAAAVAAGVAAGLDAAHAAGVLHRDLKPGNVMLVPEAGGARPVITDFGLAREEEPDASARVTREGGFVGTPAYMAPEQVEGGAITARTDVYAFGVLLFEAVTGSLPFAGSHQMAVAAQRIRRPAPSPRAVSRAVDARWDQVIRRCLAPQPERRYPTAGAAVRDLRRWRPGRRLWLALALAAMAGGVAVALWPRPSAPPLASPRAPAVRRALAVVPLADDDVPAAEALRLALSGDRLRSVPAIIVSDTEEDLGQARGDLARPEARRRLAAALAVDNLVVVGGERVVLCDAGGAELATTTRAAADRLLARLGAAGQAPAWRAPSDPAGLRALTDQRSDPHGRRDALAAAAAAEPRAVTYVELAEGERILGHHDAAMAAAGEARRLAADGTAESRLRVLGELLFVAGARDELIVLLAGLLATYPDDVESGLWLARRQSDRGYRLDARRTLEQLRRTLSPRSDARLELFDVRIADRIGDSRSARDLAAHLVIQARAEGRQLLLADALRLQAAYEGDVGDLEEARALADEAVRVCAGAPSCRGNVVLAQAETAIELGELARARGVLDALLATESWPSKFAPPALLDLADLELRRGDASAAAAALARVDALQQVSFAMDADLVRAGLARSAGRLADAEELGRRVIARGREDGDQHFLAGALLEVAGIEVERGELDEARRLVDEATTIYTALGHRLGLGRCRKIRAEAALAAKDAVAAEAEARAAGQVFTTVHAREDEAVAAGLLAGALRAQGRMGEARAALASLAGRSFETAAARRAQRP